MTLIKLATLSYLLSTEVVVTHMPVLGGIDCNYWRINFKLIPKLVNAVLNVCDV